MVKNQSECLIFKKIITKSEYLGVGQSQIEQNLDLFQLFRRWIHHEREQVDEPADVFPLETRVRHEEPFRR